MPPVRVLCAWPVPSRNTATAPPIRPSNRTVGPRMGREPARPRQGSLGGVPGRVSFQAHPDDRCRPFRVRRAGKRANACRPNTTSRERALRDHTPRPAAVLNSSSDALRNPRRRFQCGRPTASLRKKRVRLRSANDQPHRWARDWRREPARPRQESWGVVPGRVSFQAHPEQALQASRGPARRKGSERLPAQHHFA